MKHEDVPDNKEIFVSGFKHSKTDKVDICMIIRCESDELYESDKLFNFWSRKISNEEIEKRGSKITGWCFVTIVKGNNFF